MALRSWCFALICLGALAACENQPFPGQNPTPASPVAPPPPAPSGESVVIEDTTVTESTPEGTVTDSTVVVMEEDDSAALKARDAERSQAVEDCYAYAASQVARDYEVQGDSSSVIDNANQSQDISAFTTRMDDYGNQRRKEYLYNSCMTSRGYPQ